MRYFGFRAARGLGPNTTMTRGELTEGLKLEPPVNS